MTDPDHASGEHRVLKYRPRTSDTLPHGARLSDAESSDEPPRDADDFRHRMVTNAAAIAATVVLTALGIWLATSIADLRRTQDCVLMGRRDCARIAVSPPS